MPQSITRSERLHPEVRALLEMIDAQGAPPLETQDPVEARNSRVDAMKMLGGEPDVLGYVENLSIPGPGPGPSSEIPVRVYAIERGGALRPALVYFHGGGFVFGNLDTHDAVCRAIAKDSGAAGGNLATVVAIRCRDAGGPALSAQVLIYPVTDSSSFETDSHRQFGENYFLTRAGMEWFTGHYLTSADQKRHPEVSPLLAPNLSGLPPALVITAEFDPLRDEGEAYARRLEQAGVPVTVTRYPGMIHGFVSMRGVLSGGRQATKEAAEFTRSTSRKSVAV